jgi:CRP/FNR family transcriptional regulator
MRLGKSLYEAKQVALKSCPICSSLSPGSLEVIAAMAQERIADKGEYLVTEGDACDGFYLVLAGRARVFKTSANGREKALLIAERGFTFGEDALFGEGTFLENAVALERSTVLRIPRPEFLALLRKNPDLAFQVMESLCGWIRRLSSSVENVAFLGAKDKVVRYLVNLSEKTEDPKKLELTEKKKDIADRLGITPETFSRVMHDLEQKGICRVQGKQIQVEDPEALREESALL